MAEIKKQVAESSSKKPFRPFRRNQPTNPQPLNTISNDEIDDEDEDEATFSPDEFQDKQIVELNGMWDFILPMSDSENEHEGLPVSTRSKGPYDPTQSIKKKKPSTPLAKDKDVNKKFTSTSNQAIRSSSNSMPSPKTLVAYDNVEYNIVEDMKKVK